MKNLIFISILLLLISACNIINPPEEIPAYIYLTKYDFMTNVETEGSNSQNITDAWIYVGGDFLGAYSLPASFPVLKTGVQEVVVDAGVPDNGISTTPAIYYLYKRIETSIDLTAGVTDTLKLETTYADNAIFLFHEEFETTPFVFDEDVDQDDDTFLEVSENQEFEGKSGYVKLTEEHPILQVSTSKIQELPDRGRAIYLELDYKSAVDLRIGLVTVNSLGEQTADFKHGLRSASNWKKAYLNLTDQMKNLINSNPSGYKIVISAAIPFGSTLEEAEVFIDNVKLVHN